MPEPAPLEPFPAQLSGFARRKRNIEELSLGNTTPRKRQHLRISIPPTQDTEPAQDDQLDNIPISGLSAPDSLFDEPTTTAMNTRPEQLTPALLTAPPIAGLFFTPSLRLPQDVADAVMQYCLDTYFHAGGVNQVMLFGRFLEATSDSVPSSSPPSGLPSILLRLLCTLETMMLPLLPSNTHKLLFPRVPTRARQAILNLYQPGEGISPHVDLLKRFGDGIIGVSLGSGCAMQFARLETADQSLGNSKDRWNVYLPERSVIVLSEDARYGWTHGIDKRKADYVALNDPGAFEDATGRWVHRGVRLSITFRWLLPGADIVGQEEEYDYSDSRILGVVYK